MFPQPDMWKKCLDCIEELQTILFEHNNIFIGENIAEDSENLANTDQVCSWVWNKYDDVSCFSEKLASTVLYLYHCNGSIRLGSHQNGLSYLENFPNVSTMLLFCCFVLMQTQCF